MACGWQAPAQGDDPDMQETPAVQGGWERVAGFGVAPHMVLWAGKSCKMSSVVHYVASSAKKLKFSLCIVHENLKSYFKWIQKERKLRFSFSSSTGFV